MTRLIAQVDDISERRAVEERLRESEERLRAFTSHSPALMCLKDREGRYRFVNDASSSATAARGAGARAHRRRAVPAPPGARAAAHDAAVLARGEPLQYEERARDGGGQRVSLVSKFPVFDAAGTVVGVGMVANDITDRRLTEQALREQRTLLAEAQKVAGLGCWEWDPDSGRVLWSERALPHLRRAAGELPPSFEAYLERVHPEDRQQSGAMVARALMDSRSFTMQERIVRPGGEVRYLRSHGEVVRNERGKPIKILGACLDVTEQRHSESALRQAAQDLHGLTRRLVQAEEAERRRIARELHDRVGQSLSALNINLDIILRTRRLPPAPPAAGGLARAGRRHAAVDRERDGRAAPAAARRVRPRRRARLARRGILAAHRHPRQLGGRRARSGPRTLRPEAAVALFRIAQEALNNVLKHAQAKNVSMEISATEQQLMLEVRDDGQGFDPAAARARALGHDRRCASARKPPAGSSTWNPRRAGHPRARPGSAVDACRSASSSPTTTA